MKLFDSKGRLYNNCFIARSISDHFDVWEVDDYCVNLFLPNMSRDVVLMAFGTKDKVVWLY